MRWIESLETTATLHRRRLDELWAEVQRLVRAEPWEASEAADAAMAAAEVRCRGDIARYRGDVGRCREI